MKFTQETFNRDNQQTKELYFSSILANTLNNDYNSDFRSQ